MKNAYDDLLDSLQKPISPLGNKPVNLDARIKEAQRLSQLMSSTPSFSFIRLGDMELSYLLASQGDTSGAVLFDDGPTGGTYAYTNPGIGLEHASSLREAFEQATYVDFHERLWPISELLPKLKLKRPQEAYRNPDAETSYILLTWLEHEFARYCTGRRVAFVGAEAGLLAELCKSSQFCEVREPYWPHNANIFFQKVRDDGRNLNSNLPLIKQDLRDLIKSTQADTVFVSLGGAAKMLCVELAKELGVCMFDAGSMLRALTYSGSDGNRACRSPHFPFLYRVPFSVWCNAMEQTWPSLAPHEKLAKIHAQLIAEVQLKEIGWTHASVELDFNLQNRESFLHIHKEYLDKYSDLFSQNSETQKERSSFLHFCGVHRLTSDGENFLRKFKLKTMARKFLRPILGR